MEDAEEIEGFYEKEMERLDKEFLENIKKTKDKRSLKKEYKANLLTLRSEYEKKYERYLQTQKRRKEEKPKKKKKEKKEIFRVTPLNFRKTRKERFQIRYEPLWFRFKIKIKNFFRKITPTFLLVFYLKLKLHVKRGLQFTKESIKRILSKAKENIISEAKKTGETAKKTYVKIKNFLGSILKKIISKIKPKKKEDKGGKTEDQKLAEKILAKKD